MQRSAAVGARHNADALSRKFLGLEGLEFLGAGLGGAAEARLKGESVDNAEGFRYAGPPWAGSRPALPSFIRQHAQVPA